ncbi:hypothetical protein JCM10207_000445 [Rhodosporidiobolus poonsookiae]
MSYGTRESPYPPPGTVQPQEPASTYQPPSNGAPPSMQAPQYGGGGNYGQQQQYGYNGNGGAYQQQGGYGQPQQGGFQPSQAAQYYQQQEAAGGQKYNAPPPPQQQQQYAMGEKFEVPKPKFNDLIFALLFLAQLGAFIAISVISLRALPSSSDTGGLGNSSGSAITLNSSTAYLLTIICGAALVFSIILLMIVRAFTKIILEITLALAVLLSIAYAVYLWVIKYWSGAIIFTIFAIFSIIAYPGMRRRIPLSKQLLIYVLRVAKHNPSVYVIALLGTLLQAAYSVYWSFTAVAIYQKWTPGSSGSGTSAGTASHGAVIGLMVFAVFSYFWTSQFIINLFLTTEAGVFGTYYYEPDSPGKVKVAWGAFKRASTYSFGSIAFGSLIVALLDLLRAFFQLLQSYESQEGNAIGACVACCAQCCVGILANAVEYFNRKQLSSSFHSSAVLTLLLLSQIALYGKKYLSAAKDTWRLFKDRGITLLINDCLVGNIWTFGSFAVGALCSAFAFIYLKVLNPSYVEQNGDIKAAVMGYAFMIGFIICHTLGYGALQSGVSTTFVALGEDPEVLAERDPQLFELIRQAYPQVVTSV